MRIPFLRKKPLTKIGRFWALTPAQMWQMRAQILAFAVALYLVVRPVTWTDFLWPYFVLLVAFYWVNRLLWKLYATWKNGKLGKLQAYDTLKRASGVPRPKGVNSSPPDPPTQSTLL